MGSEIARYVGLSFLVIGGLYAGCVPIPGTEVECDDQRDNDLDGAIDCDDNDCDLFAACSDDTGDSNGNSELCNNGADDDGDQAVDCDDSDCYSHPACTGGDVESDCSDSLDNDNDGATDCADSDCFGDPACSSTGPEVDCGDHVDNDGDGATDCFDTDCFSDPACSASNVEYSCGDGLDNDGDGDTDCFDSDCFGTSDCTTTGIETLCADGLDNDNDGDVDCDDSDCAGQCGPLFEPEYYYAVGSYGFDGTSARSYTVVEPDGTSTTYEPSLTIFLISGDQSTYCYVDLRAPGPLSAPGWVSGSPFAFGFEMSANASVNTDCDALSFSPAVWGNDPVDRVLSHTWGLGHGPLSPSMRTALKDAVDQDPALDWAVDWEPFVGGAGLYLDSLVTGTSDGTVEISYSAAWTVDNSMTLQIDGNGNSPRLSASQIDAGVSGLYQHNVIFYMTDAPDLAN